MNAFRSKAQICGLKKIKHVRSFSQQQLVQFERIPNNKGVAVITLANSAGRNSFSMQFIRELQSLVKETNKDTNIRALIIRSSVPKIFCAGADLKERLTMTNTEV